MTDLNDLNSLDDIGVFIVSPFVSKNAYKCVSYVVRIF